MKQLKSLFPLNLLTKMILLICLLLITIAVALGIYSKNTYSNMIKEQVGMSALQIAETVATIPEIKEALQHDSPTRTIQPLAEEIRKATDSEFIVIGNRDGIRYSHPQESQIGRPMVGDDNDRALHLGEAYISEAMGSLGPSIRGKAPIFSDDSEIIGVVSVGLLVDDIDVTIKSYVHDIWTFIVIFLIIGIIGAISISLHIKKAILGLEPKEIGQLYLEREAMLQSVHEALIAVDQDGIVTMSNHAATNILAIKETDITGKYVKELLPNTTLIEVLETGKSQFNQELWIGDNRYIVNTVPMYQQSKRIGAVSTFRNTTEIEKLASELAKVKQYSEALRVQTHEFTNKLNTIVGLLQLGEVDRAIGFIHKESRKQQKWIHFFIKRIADPFISALLLGKLNRAHELGIDVHIDPASNLTEQLSEKQRSAFITIIGNLLDNAFDAVLDQKGKREISLCFIDEEHGLTFEIEDSGKGIQPDQQASIFHKGYTTKDGKHRGIGLALVQELLNDLNGTIIIDNSGLGGACFIVSIPIKKEG